LVRYDWDMKRHHLTGHARSHRRHYRAWGARGTGRASRGRIGNSRHCILGICPAHVDAQRYHFWKAHAERSLARVGTEYRTGVLWCAPHGWHIRAQNCGLAALAMSLDRFNQALAAVASFKDCQRVLTVGNLNGIETSTRRMNRTERLATIRVAYHGQNVICLDVYCRHDRRCKSAHPGDLSNPIGRPACIQGGVAGSGVRFRRSADRATRW